MKDSKKLKQLIEQVEELSRRVSGLEAGAKYDLKRLNRIEYSDTIRYDADGFPHTTGTTC